MNPQKMDRNYPLNCWWVAARADEVGREPFRRWLLDVPVALFRQEDGTPVALDDRCPHRWAKLSDGYLEGDTIVCPYHGARFGESGACTRFPGQDTPPARMAVKSFPLVERGRFIWIWMGDPERAQDVELPPTFDWEHGEGFVSTTGGYQFDANYFLLQENVLDLTHFNYVHANSFGIKNWNPKPEYMIEDGRAGLKSVLYPEDFPSIEERAILGLAHPSTLRSEGYSWMETPAYHFHDATVYREENPDLPQTSKSYVVHMTTPANARQTYYWWLVATDFPMPEEAKAMFSAFIEAGYVEDKAVLEGIQETLDKDPRGLDYPEITVGADAGGMLARRVLAKMMQAEKSETAEASEA